jgi:hypothetical protein
MQHELRHFAWNNVVDNGQEAKLWGDVTGVEFPCSQTGWTAPLAYSVCYKTGQFYLLLTGLTLLLLLL